jgi:hypothetical protein
MVTANVSRGVLHSSRRLLMGVLVAAAIAEGCGRSPAAPAPPGGLLTTEALLKPKNPTHVAVCECFCGAAGGGLVTVDVPASGNCGELNDTRCQMPDGFESTLFSCSKVVTPALFERPDQGGVAP